MNATFTYGYEKLKSHSDYVITNSAWKLMEMSLSQYLESLKVTQILFPRSKWSGNMSYDVLEFAGIHQFYLRQRYYNQSEKTVIKDPWNRDFVLFPGIYNKWQIVIPKSKYDYHTYESDYVDGQVYVLVTTVNGERVYCVDVVKNKLLVGGDSSSINNNFVGTGRAICVWGWAAIILSLYGEV